LQPPDSLRGGRCAGNKHPAVQHLSAVPRYFFKVTMLHTRATRARICRQGSSVGRGRRLRGRASSGCQERNLEVADGTGNRYSRSVHAEKNNRERPIAESPMTAFFRTNRQTWFNTKCTSNEVRLCGAQRCRSRSPRSVSTRPMASDEALELVSRGRPKRFVHLEANANTECFEWCPTVLVRVLRLLHPPSTSRAASRSRMRRGVL
jgi:hypothetical protein